MTTVLSEPWTMDEIKSKVLTALPLRVPRFEIGTAPGIKIAALEDYLLESAYHRAEMDEAIHWLDLFIEQMKNRVNTITGYEPALPPKRAERITRDDVLQAKRTIDPTTFELGAEMRQLRETTRRLVVRFDHEFAVCSRVYTVITGG